MAARPGTSLHNHGIAIDIDSADGNLLNRGGLLGKYNFNRPLSSEPWHIEDGDFDRVALSKKGVDIANYWSRTGKLPNKDPFMAANGACFE